MYIFSAAYYLSLNFPSENLMNGMDLNKNLMSDEEAILEAIIVWKSLNRNIKIINFIE